MVQDWVASVVSAQKGDLAAFEIIVRQFEDMAVGYAYSILGDFALAEDAAQEAFIQAYIDLGMLKEPVAFPAWLRRIVFKQCDRFSRKKRPPMVSLEATPELPAPWPGPLEALQQRETHDAVLAAVGSLPEHERVTTTLFYINGYSLAEVGEFLEVPVSTVKNRLHSARKRMQERMVGQVGDVLKQHAPDEGFRRRVRKVLEGIQRIHWGTTSVLCFVGSTVACMHYLDEPVDNDYVMGISGGAFKFFWFPGWSPALCDLLLLGEEPVRRTFAALGYRYTFLQTHDRPVAEDLQRTFREQIVDSIDRGVPVIAIGIVGPPEACVVSGYDKGGAVLYGRSYFQHGADAYYRVEDWEKECFGLILIGEKTAKPSSRQVLRDSLEWAVALARVPERNLTAVGAEFSGMHYSGLAAYDAMAEALLQDEYFPAGDLDTLTYRTYALSNDGIYLMTGKRASAAAFLNAMAEEGLPGTNDLRRAAGFYMQEVEILEQAMGLAPWSGAPEAERLALVERPRREEISRLVRAARVPEEQAVQCLERALAALA